MNKFKNADGKSVLLAMVKAIQDNKAYLGEVDGLIGDGDHGMNMNKGFTIFGNQIADKDISFTNGLSELASVLMVKIGGSMGPIYGTIFDSMADTGAGLEEITVKNLADMVEAGLNGLHEIVKGEVGDKSIVDTLDPAMNSLKASAAARKDLKTALEDMKAAAKNGMESTKDMVAKFGRSSRLGERSRGVLDAGATSCCIILTAIADGIIGVMS